MSLDELKLKLKIPYPLKNMYKTVIPLNIYQTWYTKELPTNMFNNVRKIKQNNPAFTYYLYDDNDCHEFIKNNFDSSVLNAFDSLIPGAYKADLWRYCILYINGGIYLDIKYSPYNNFKFINLSEKEHLVLDADNFGIYNALMACKPKNDLCLRAINNIVENVKNKKYGSNNLEPTGPKLLWNIITNDEKINMLDMKHGAYFNDPYYKCIFYNNYLIFKAYNNYMIDYNNSKKEHYASLWNKRQIYK
jgi:mannosyltransferase OCH1-like enzyme